MFISVSERSRLAVTAKAESTAQLVVELTSGFVETYSGYAADVVGDDLPIPAKFRADALAQMELDSSDDQSFRTAVVGLPGREIGRTASDDVTKRLLNKLSQSPDNGAQTEIFNKDNRKIHRSVWPFYAAKGCADCHNHLQELSGSEAWQVGDLMGAQVFDKDVSSQLNSSFVNAIVQSILLFIALTALWLSGLYLVRHIALSRQFKQLASIDPLTGCINRRELYNRIARLKDRSSGCLLMLDLDNFKRINDTYGHNAGDKVITDFAGRLRNSVRSNDWITRLGGEEFLVWLPDINPADAIRLAERLRVNVENAKVSLDDEQIQYTVSIGLKLVKDTTPTLFERWIHAADELLYRAKQQGRNCIVCA